MKNTLENAINKILLGAYDLHIHPAPSPFHRLCDDIQLLKEAGRAGMGGILLKSHYESTAVRATLANQYCASSTQAYGGLVLNWPVGGLNPYAVENALIRGAKIIWMPTRDAANSLLSGDMPGDFFKRQGITVLNENGQLKDEIYEIFRIVKKYNAALATGHISPEESIILCKKGRQAGVRMILTHPEFIRTQISETIQAELAHQDVWIEHCWYNIAEGNCSAKEMADHIRSVGAEHCYLSTDRGQGNREHPVEAMKQFIKTLLQEGISAEEIRTMLISVPIQVLGIQEVDENGEKVV